MHTPGRANAPRVPAGRNQEKTRKCGQHSQHAIATTARTASRTRSKVRKTPIRIIVALLLVVRGVDPRVVAAQLVDCVRVRCIANAEGDIQAGLKWVRTGDAVRVPWEPSALGSQVLHVLKGARYFNDFFANDSDGHSRQTR